MKNQPMIEQEPSINDSSDHPPLKGCRRFPRASNDPPWDPDEDPLDYELDIDYSKGVRNAFAELMKGKRAEYSFKDGMVRISYIPIQDPPSEADLKVHTPEEIRAIVDATNPYGLSDEDRAIVEKCVAHTLSNHLASITRREPTG